MVHAISLGIALLALWLLLSGFFEPLLLALSLLSCALVVWIAVRMDVVDHEAQPVHLHLGRWLLYLLWLLREIAIANVAVARIILDARLPISPTIARLECSQHSELGQVIYANSITLTPGTVSINLGGGAVGVHALTHEAAEALYGGEMDRRVTRLETD